MRAGTKALAIASLAFIGYAAQAGAVQTCADSVLPTLGTDANPGLIPAGPALLETGAAGYTYAVNSGNDNLEFYVQSAPGVGTNATYTRKLWIALTATSVGAYPVSVSPSGCERAFTTLVSDLSSLPAGLTVTKTTDLTDETTVDNEATCVFNHLYTTSWNNFRDSLGSCGFTISSNASSPTNGTFRNFRGRIHVKWEDFNATGASTPVRPAANTWYDVTIQVQDTANFTANPVSGTEVPYNADFKVDSVTYTKADNGAVTASIQYSLSTAYPYYARVPAGAAATYLLNTAGVYAGLTLGGTWAHTATRDGDVLGDGTDCDAAGETCVLSGTLTYTWTPTTGSCSISAATPYQFDFQLDCAAGVTNNDCGEAMRLALAEPNFGQFRIAGNIDFCAASTTDFPVTWSTPFDVTGGSTRQIGARITTTGTLDSNKRIYGIALKDYRVARSGLTGTWSLWTAGDPTLVLGAEGYAGSLSTIGTNTGFEFATPVEANGGLRWTVSASFTPNIRLNTAAQNYATVDAQGPYMIALPDDRGDTISYTMTIGIRMYTDNVVGFNSRRRRLLFRDVEVPSVTPSAIKDSEATTNPVSVTIPNNVEVSKDGKVTVQPASSGLSTGAIAGIAVGAVVAVAAVGAAIFFVRRNKRAAPQDAEKVPAMSYVPSQKIVA